MTEAETDSKPANPLFDANMAALAKWAPEVHAALAAIEAPFSNIVVLPDGGVDISLRGQAFYGGDGVAFAQQQLDAYLEAPLRWTINRPDGDTLKGTCGAFIEALEAELAAAGIEVQSEIAGQSARFALMFGVGLGLQVAPLIAHSQARAVILIEPMVENLYHSMFVVDWAEIFAAAERDGRKLLFVVDADSAKIAARVRMHIRANNPTMLDGVYVFPHYGSSILNNARDQVQREFFLNITGLGFFEDELVMLANGSANLNRPAVRIIDRPLAMRDTPVFIVGSGPSVDGLMPTIKAYRDHAIVISIGSGLRGLLAHGLRPDFHVEVENVLATAFVIDTIRAEFGLDGITLLAPITVRPEVVEAFDEAFLFFRERVTSTLLYKEHHRELSPAGPTVANSALIAAIRFGFHNVFLFGVDMGTMDADVYHSADSVFGQGLLAEICPVSSSSPGNFGGTAHADNVFAWSRQTLEGVLAAHGYVQCTNCSDGALIAGATPRLASTLSFEGEAIDRTAIKDDIRDGLAVFTADRRQAIWTAADLPRRAAALTADLLSIIDRAADEDTVDWMGQIYDRVWFDSRGAGTDKGGEGASADGVVRTLVFGTVLLMLGCAQWYHLRLKNAGDEPAFRRLALAALREAFAAMGQRADELLGDVAAYCAGDRDDIPLIDWSLLMRPELAERLAARA